MTPGASKHDGVMATVKKGKKMPAIEIEGSSTARYELRDGKIVRVDEDAPRPAGPGADFGERVR